MTPLRRAGVVAYRLDRALGELKGARILFASSSPLVDVVEAAQDGT